MLGTNWLHARAHHQSGLLKSPYTIDALTWIKIAIDPLSEPQGMIDTVISGIFERRCLFKIFIAHVVDHDSLRAKLFFDVTGNIKVHPTWILCRGHKKYRVGPDL